MRRERVEDLGVIRQLMQEILDETEFFSRACSKHSVDSFCERYGNLKNLEELHDEIRYLKDRLWKVFSVAEGDYDDPY